MTGGTIKNIKLEYAVMNNGTTSLTGGTISGNVNNTGNTSQIAVYHNGTSLTVKKSYDEGQYIYLAGDSKYITTESSAPKLYIWPNKYTEGRKVVATNGSSYASTQTPSEHAKVFGFFQEL